MICPDCQGCGGYVEDDEGIQCCRCGGTGQRSLWFDLAVWMDVQRDRIRDWWRFTRMGQWWWKAYGRERNARNRAAGRTAFELSVKHGDILNRLRGFATALEDGADVGQWYRIETRIESEYRRACEIAAARDGQK